MAAATKPWISRSGLSCLYRDPPLRADPARKCDPLHATFINGISSHVDDFDDFIPKNYIHATGAVASALLHMPAAARARLSQAFVLGFGHVTKTSSPWHYQTGWHITSTTSVFGAPRRRKVRKLPAEKLVWALSLAATQSAGVRETFGSMAKAMHPGRADKMAFSALLAGAALAGRGIEGRGFALVQSVDRDLRNCSTMENTTLDNTYKPYPTGIVIQPNRCLHPIFNEHDPIRR